MNTKTIAKLLIFVLLPVYFAIYHQPRPKAKASPDQGRAGSWRTTALPENRLKPWLCGVRKQPSISWKRMKPTSLNVYYRHARLG
jgi:hypothetical protein